MKNPQESRPRTDSQGNERVRCPCGYLGDPRRACKCSPITVEKYMGRLSGPLLDRIDLHVEVPAVAYAELSAKADGTSSAEMRNQVLAARERQRVRFGQEGSARESRMLNARMFGRLLRKHCGIDSDGQSLLKSAMDDLGLSARAHDRILKVARTIADLSDADSITANHLAEAIGYRTLDRKLWLK